MKAFTIGAVSFQPELWEPEKNLRQLLGLTDEAAQCGAQVIATPEGILDGYISRELVRLNIREVDRGSKGFDQRLARFRKRQVALAKKIKQTCLPALHEKAAEHVLTRSIDPAEAVGRGLFGNLALARHAGPESLGGWRCSSSTLSLMWKRRAARTTSA